jgi:hypothetical protein
MEKLKGREDFEILVSSDEELKNLCAKLEVAELEDKPRTLVIYRLSGSETR